MFEDEDCVAKLSACDTPGAGFGDHAFILLGLNGTAMRRRFLDRRKTVT